MGKKINLFELIFFFRKPPFWIYLLNCVCVLLFGNYYFVFFMLVHLLFLLIIIIIIRLLFPSTKSRLLIKNFCCCCCWKIDWLKDLFCFFSVCVFFLHCIRWPILANWDHQTLATTIHCLSNCHAFPFFSLPTTKKKFHSPCMNWLFFFCFIAQYNNTFNMICPR